MSESSCNTEDITFFARNILKVKDQGHEVI